jgi:hypothetical protein
LAGPRVTIALICGEKSCLLDLVVVAAWAPVRGFVRLVALGLSVPILANSRLVITQNVVIIQILIRIAGVTTRV